MKMSVKKTKIQWTEELIVDKLSQHLLSSSTTRYLLNNLYVFSNCWESDYLSLTNSGYFYEGEVKISKSDFKADFKKEQKHLILENSFKNEKTDNSLCPHYFFYAVPEGLVTIDEVPEYAGLVYMTDFYPYYQWVKKAPLLHKVKYDDSALNLQDKFYYNMINWKRKALKDFPDKINHMKKLLKESKTDDNGKTHTYTLNEYANIVKIKDSEIEFLKNQLTTLIDDCESYKLEIRELKKKEREV